MTLEDLQRNRRYLETRLEAGELTREEYNILASGMRAAYREEAPLRRHARRKVQTEREAGRLVPPPRCEACGSTKPLEAHHPDHREELEVRWLCSTDHNDADRTIFIIRS